MTKSPVQELTKLHEHVAKLSGWNLLEIQVELADAIAKAQQYKAPMGNPEHIETVSSSYRQAAVTVDTVSVGVSGIATAGLPASWTGHAGESAAEAIGAAARDAERMATTFQEVAPVLFHLADGIRQAQAQHTNGRLALDSALSLLAEHSDARPDDLVRVRSIALDGIGQLLQAAICAEEAGQRAEKTLHKMASQARAGKLGGPGLTDTDRLVLADAANPTGPHDLNTILSASDLQRSSQFRDRLIDTDREEFDHLLAQAQSPEERAYLMKALAAGHDMADIRPYAQAIRGHNRYWLAQHLSPLHTDSTTLGVNTPADFSGAAWKQDDHEGTCVASSTITARAMADPLYALRLTTGGRPGDPKSDSPEAFRKRLLDEQHRVHEEGHGGELPEGSMDGKGEDTILRKEVSPYSASNYRTFSPSSTQDRHDALPDIEAAVDEGRPVPVNVQGHDEKGKWVGHAMLIVAHDGDKLQIYNPWGHTVWVTEDDFINNHLDKASDAQLPEAYEYRLPQ
ncbi:peptidoglycan-binding protein [Streptomyces sp. NPDC052396]|uniref:peptidoglycan-binding protein n=1 Tax=Streptomyces sp. NPDC052396 TaxID=3365689 RepID=UPI0037CF7968